MPRKFFISVCISVFILIAGFAAEIGKGNPNQEKPEFLQIFNGQDLTGWDGDPAFWSVKDGIIIAQVPSNVQVKDHSYLIWQGGKVRDFELHVAVRSTAGNSGIDYRAQPVLADRDGQQLKWTIQGYQSDIAKDWMGSLYNWGKPGAQPGQFVVVAADPPVTKYTGSVVEKQALFDAGYYKPGQWNEFTIIARCSHILHKINGFPVVEFIDNSSATRREGILGLQVHSGKGPFLTEFQDLRLKHFDTKFGQAKYLLDTNDLSGWLFSTPDAKSAWILQNGVLINKTKSNGFIYTKDDYADYILRFQYRSNGDKGSVLLRLTGLDKQEPNCIRITGEGDNFDHIIDVGNPALKVVAFERHPAFKKMPPGYWNECEILLNKGKLLVHVNDLLQIAATNCRRNPGKIAFEAAGSRMEFRNIVLIPILE